MADWSFLLSIPSGQTLALATGGAAAALLFLVGPALILRKYIRIMINIMDDHAAWLGNRGRDLARVNGEEIEFRASDGQLLSGTIFRGDYDDHPLGIVIFAHEFRSDRTSCVTYCAGLLAEGYDVFAFDFRGHGASGANRDYRPRQWPSDREQADVVGAIAFVSSWLEQQGRSRDVILFGVSRGAGAAILAAEGVENVRAIIADGAYSSDATLEYLMKRFATIFARIRVVAENHPPVFWRFLRWLLFREFARRFGCRFPSVRKSISRLGPKPLLMIHGEKDSYIPVSLAQALFERARGPKCLWIVPGARHNEGVLVHPISYNRHITTFLREHHTAAHDQATHPHFEPLPYAHAERSSIAYGAEPVPVRVSANH